jgi:hypothetical protein
MPDQFEKYYLHNQDTTNLFRSPDRTQHTAPQHTLGIQRYEHLSSTIEQPLFGDRTARRTQPHPTASGEVHRTFLGGGT